ncbi:hypothetical protein J1C67_18190 [Clostridium gasigenes]|uniref:hypothetical protein n=1 Tax=Clostridium gasigenes TaxID=94869 RepID=UPI00143838B3|nr:hypothetical protein [Clostridium gasigenes]MBU3132637.1 hypothetical protein [Clostridium gasigenes]NKF05834.1 hypothetical protein [Clostridium gasigenes]QSW19433.1 hypothetical protein J1C67_18190 [Clostridium gasigenes]
MIKDIKIYNKKKFWSGVLSLSLVLMSIVILFLKPKSFDLKGFFITLFLLLIGISDISRSINLKDTKKDIQEDDERKYLIELKSSSAAFTISQYLLCILFFIGCFSWYITKIEAVLYVIIPIGCMTGINVIIVSITYFYQQKRN